MPISFPQFVRFLLRFAAIYAFLIFPWPGGDAAYAAWFRTVTQISCQSFQPGWHAETHALAPSETRPLDTRYVIANTRAATNEGVPARMLDLDSRGVGWIPTAWTMALILATPLSFRNRLIALATGLLLIHLFILFSVWSLVANGSSDLFSAPAWWRELTGALRYTLITQMGPGFVFPVLIWITVVLAANAKKIADSAQCQ